MTDTFAATTLMQTVSTPDTNRLGISLADASGRTLNLRLTAELSAALSEVLRDFSTKTASPSAALTKKPDGFAVGTGKHESVVLVRFEDDTPYGLSPREAVVLGRALIEQAELLRNRPSLVLQ